MSPESDRIAVPTNGHRPHPVVDLPPAPIVGVGAPDDDETSVALTPRQLAVGLGVITSVLLLVAGLARRRPPRA